MVNSIAIHVNPLNRMRSSRYSDRRRSARHICDNHSVCSDLCVSTNADWPENLCPGTYVNMARNFWDAASIARSNGHLLEDQAVHADPGIGMNDDSIGMRNEQSAANMATQGNVCACHDAPEAMPQDDPFASEARYRPFLGTPVLVAPDCQEQLSARIPEAARGFARPVRDFGADADLRLFYPAIAHLSMTNMYASYTG